MDEDEKVASKRRADKMVGRIASIVSKHMRGRFDESFNNDDLLLVSDAFLSSHAKKQQESHLTNLAFGF